MTTTNELVSNRFSSSESYANSAVARAQSYMTTLTALLDSLALPTYAPINEIDFTNSTPIDYNARPSFTAHLDSFPTFNNTQPERPALEAVPSVSVNIPTDNVEFTEKNYVAPTINIGSAPVNNVNLSSISIPTKPSLSLPTVPTLNDILIPAAPDINIMEFSATPPSITELNSPSGFNYTPNPYNSDIRVPLFAKILYDLQNGGTGLDSTVEADIYARGVERQRVENEALYRDTENRFTATGFELPTGALASALQAVAEEISRKNDQLNREITISQADLAQKNTQFTTEQARQLEALLVEFYNNQEGRTLEASKAIAQNSIDIFNTIIENQKLKLVQYQTEASVFETKVKAQLTAVEMYKAEIEGAKAASDVQIARVNIYNAQLSGLETLMKMYAVEMDSVKIQTEIQMAKIEAFKAEIEAYVAGVGAEKIKVDIFGSQVESEKTRAIAYGERVKALGLKVEAAKAEAEIKQMNSENVLKNNQLKISEFSELLNKYRAEIESEIKAAQLQVEAFKTEAAAFEAETSAVGMEYNAKINEGNLKVEEFKAKVLEQISIINSTRDGYVALKSLQEKGIEGVMNANAQLAASAMNSVNASAGLSGSYSDSESESTSYTHSYQEKCCE